MKDFRLELSVLVNKLHLLKCSNMYNIDNSSELTKDHFVISSVALDYEITEIEKRLSVLLDEYQG